MGGIWKNRPDGYWKDWYWNKGGRDRVQAKRKINGFVGYKKKLD